MLLGLLKLLFPEPAQLLGKRLPPFRHQRVFV